MTDNEQLLSQVESAVREALAQAETQDPSQAQEARGVLSATGTNRPGIVARFSAVMAELNLDILEINQTVLRGVFTMVIVFDLASLEQAGMAFQVVKDRLERTAKSIGVHAVVLHEDILNAMHRI